MIYEYCLHRILILFEFLKCAISRQSARSRATAQAASRIEGHHVVLHRGEGRGDQHKQQAEFNCVSAQSQSICVPSWLYYILVQYK